MINFSTFDSLIKPEIGCSFFTDSLQKNANPLALIMESFSSSSQSMSNGYYKDLSKDIGHNKISDFDKVSAELVSYQDLEHDWDGYGGVAPDYSTVALAFNFMSELYAFNLKLPKLMVSGSGDISFYWKDKETNSYLEIQFDSGNKYSYFIESCSELCGKDDVDFHEVSIAQEIHSFLKLTFSNDLLFAA